MRDKYGNQIDVGSEVAYATLNYKSSVVLKGTVTEINLAKYSNSLVATIKPVDKQRKLVNRLEHEIIAL